MVVSIGGAAFLACLLCFPPLMLISLACGVTGAILGHVGRKQVRERGERGGGMALAGIIVGWCAAGLSIVLGVLYVLLFLFNSYPGGFTTY